MESKYINRYHTFCRSLKNLKSMYLNIMRMIIWCNWTHLNRLRKIEKNACNLSNVMII